MVAWADYKAAAKERGSLALELYVVFSEPAKTPEEIRSVLPEHLAYQAEREAAGELAFAGPLSDETGEQMQAMGLIVYRAADFAAADSMAREDPMHKTGCRSYTLRRWLVNEGSLQLDLKLSAQQIIMA